MALLRYLPRVGRWSALSGALLLSGVLLLWASTRDGWGPAAALGNLRLAAVMLCGAAVFTLDDPAADTTAASPTKLRHRRGAALGLALATMAVAWEALLRGGFLLLDDAADACLALVRWPLTVELLWLFAVGVAVAAVTARRLGGTAGGIAAGPTIVLLYAGVHQLPASWTLIAGGPLDPAWAPAHRRLLVLTLVAVAVAVWALRDPWRPRRSGGGRPARARGAGLVLAAAVVAVSSLPVRSATTSERLDATLDDLVASQGVERLTVAITGGDLRWARTVVAAMTGTRTAPCGTAVADALTATSRGGW